MLLTAFKFKIFKQFPTSWNYEIWLNVMPPHTVLRWRIQANLVDLVYGIIGPSNETFVKHNFKFKVFGLWSID